MEKKNLIVCVNPECPASIEYDGAHFSDRLTWKMFYGEDGELCEVCGKPCAKHKDD